MSLNKIIAAISWCEIYNEHYGLEKRLPFKWQPLFRIIVIKITKARWNQG